jgi:hypothetical protein
MNRFRFQEEASSIDSFGLDARGAARSSGRTQQPASGSAQLATKLIFARNRDARGSDTRQPGGTGSDVNPITGSCLRPHPNPSAAGAGGSCAHAREGEWRGYTCPMVPSPLHPAKPTVSHIARNVRPLTTERCGTPSSCEASLGRTVASATTFASRSGRAGEHMTGSSKKSTPPRRSLMPILTQGTVDTTTPERGNLRLS